MARAFKKLRAAKKKLFKPPPHSRQVAFHQLLVAARQTALIDALQETLKGADQRIIKSQLGGLVPADVQQILAGAGIRDEFVFPVPALLETKPSLLGYYRRLLGVPQKGFYGKDFGFARFKAMEIRGTLTTSNRLELKSMCEAMAMSLSHLIRGIEPALASRDLNDLPLLTLGSQLQGSNNNDIGKQATREVFLAIGEIVGDQRHIASDKLISFKNAAGRAVEIRLGADPDVGVWEKFDKWRPKVAVEIKGGSDRSNAHNRAGEAEKSHQKAKKAGFRDYWTTIGKSGLEEALKTESPTTRSWFDVTEILARKGKDWNDFRSRLSGELGIAERAPQ